MFCVLTTFAYMKNDGFFNLFSGIVSVYVVFVTFFKFVNLTMVCF